MIPEQIKSTLRELGLPDDTLNFALTGYPFLLETSSELGLEIFNTRFLLERVTCMTGPDAAKLFYDGVSFHETEASATLLERTLFGNAAAIDPERSRTSGPSPNFPAVFDESNLLLLVNLAEEKWERYAASWEARGAVTLLDEFAEMFCETMMAWCGVPLGNVGARTSDFRYLIESASARGTVHVRSRAARRRLDDWLEGIVRDERRCPEARPDSALGRLAHHQDGQGKVAREQDVAVELKRLIRPVVALAWHCTALVFAMHRHPERRPRPDDAAGRERFVEEVCRLHPLWPIAAAQAMRTVEFRGHVVPRGRIVFFDVFGTNRHSGTFERPHEFRPERFEKETRTGNDTRVQAATQVRNTRSRRVEDWITIPLMDLVLRKMSDLRFSVPSQDLSLCMTEIPARPESGFIIRNVRCSSVTPLHPSLGRAEMRTRVAPLRSDRSAACEGATRV